MNAESPAFQVIGVLIDNGALKENQHFVDAKGQTPLHIAIAANQVQAAEVLVLKCPAWISAQDDGIQCLLVELTFKTFKICCLETAYRIRKLQIALHASGNSSVFGASVFEDINQIDQVCAVLPS